MRPHNMVKVDEEVVNRDVKNHKGESLGKIEEIMLNKLTGQTEYVVLASGGFLGLGEKLFALPWNSLKFDDSEGCFIVNLDKEVFSKAEGFDKDNWPESEEVWTRIKITE